MALNQVAVLNTLYSLGLLLLPALDFQGQELSERTHALSNIRHSASELVRQYGRVLCEPSFVKQASKDLTEMDCNGNRRQLRVVSSNMLVHYMLYGADQPILHHDFKRKFYTASLEQVQTIRPGAYPNRAALQRLDY